MHPIHHNYAVVDDYSHLIASTSMMMATNNNTRSSTTSSDSGNETTALSVASAAISALLLDPRIVSGSVGSLVSAVVSQPFEVAKIKQQNYRSPSSTSALPFCATTTTAVRGVVASSSPVMTATMMQHTPGPLSMLRHVIAKEGFRGIYAGLAPTMIMSVPNYVLYLTAYDEIVAHLRSVSSTNHWNGVSVVDERTIPLVGGAGARLLATTAVAPLELVRTRDANAGSNHPHKKQSISRVWSDLARTVQTEGVVALYRGILPALARDVPFAALYMLCLERFRDASRPWVLGGKQQQQQHSSQQNIYHHQHSLRQQIVFEFTNAALAGMVAASCTAPLDAVKTRIQSSSPEHTTTRTNNNRSFVHVVRSIVQQDGLSGLWRGNQARMMKVAPQYAIMISFYEVGKKVLAQDPA